MPICVINQAEDRNDRACSKVFTVEDVFPHQDPYREPLDALFPEKVVEIAHQIKKQKQLVEVAQLFDEVLQLKKEYDSMTDDQKRAAKIRERLLKRKNK